MYYFWYEGKIVTRQGIVPHEDPLRGHPCVDANVDESSVRYGKWVPGGGGWRHVPYEDFPNEFKTWLLLEGIS